MNINFADYKPVGDGLVNDGVLLNKAIRDCNASGGGIVTIPGKKTYLVGLIEILSNVTLFLEEDAILKASSNLNDFYDIKIKRDSNLYIPSWENCEYDGKPSQYFIYAVGATNIGILGDGKIDGNEEIFYGKVTKWHIEGAFYPRIPLVYFENCNNIKIKNVTFQNSGFWTTHLVGSRDILIENLTIDNNLRMTNCDGIDPDHCQNVVIRNCKIKGADDSIVFKTTEAFKNYGNCENILVENCDLMSTSAAIKFGTESVSDFKNITVRNCRIHGTNRGISLMLRDEGSIENVKFENISIETRRFSPTHWWGRGEPIAITALKRKENTVLGSIKNISFKNISTSGENGIFVYGDDLNSISNIKFENIIIGLKRVTDWPLDTHDLRPSYKYGEIPGDLNTIYLKNASEIEFVNLVENVDENIKNVIKNAHFIENCKNLYLK